VMTGCRSAHTTSAILYIADENYDKAVEVIHEGFEFRDDEPDAFYYLGEAYGHLAEKAVEDDDYEAAARNYELAYDAYMRVLELDSEHFAKQVKNSLEYNYQTRVRQAQIDWNDGYYEQAEGHFRLAYAASPKSLDPIKNIARMKMQMSQEEKYLDQREELLNEALDLLDKVVAENPEAYDLQVNRANVLAALGRNDEAGEIFNTLLAEHGDDASLLVDIANLAIDDNDLERAADFYVRIVDIYEADTDPANDDDNKEMLVSAGSWYGSSNVGRYEDAIAALDHAANLELIPEAETMLFRVRTYYSYGKHLKREANEATDPALKAEFDAKSKTVLGRAVEVGVAMTSNFTDNPEGFLYLSLAQLELGDSKASVANAKIYEELKAATP